MNKTARALCILSISIATWMVPSPLQSTLASVKATGMGLVGTAYPQDSFAGVFNPAGMSEVCDRFDVGLVLENRNAHTEIIGNEIPGVDGGFNAARKHNYWDPEFAINKNICEDFTVGLMVYNRNHAYTKYDNVFPILGTSNLHVDVIQEAIAPVVTYKITENQAIGVAVDFFIQTLNAAGLQNFEAFSTDPGRVTNHGKNYSYGVGVTLGWYGRFWDCLALGVSYQPKAKMSKFSKYKGFLAHAGRLDIPETINAGLAYDILPCLTFAFDFNYFGYKNIRSLHNPLVPNIATDQLGSNGGAGFGWKNQYFYRFGLDWKALECLTLRCGYRTASKLYDANQTATNLLLNQTIRDSATVGFTYNWDDCTEISFCYARGIKKRVNGRNSIPPGLPPVGFGGGNANIDEAVNVFGLEVGHFF